MMKTFLSLICLAFSLLTYSQSAYQHVSDRNLYNFLDELAGMHLIELTTAVKPYSRMQIADYLDQAGVQRNKLSYARQAMLDKYLVEFSMERGQLKTGGWQMIKRDTTLSVHLILPEVAYRDTLFTALIRPVYGFRNFSGGDHNFWATYGGAEAITYIGNNWSVYASLRDNFQKRQRLAQPSFLIQEPGGNYKYITGGGGGGEFSEMRGGITWSWNWGKLGFIKDHIHWGDNQNGSNIFSGRTPSFPMITLQMNPARWVEFNYYHGWMVSQAIDSINSFFHQDLFPRTTHRRMYIAANIFTIKPLSKLHFSFGNSIVYGDMDVQPAYLIPFFFYKSIVHSTHWGTSYQNSAMYFNLSSRQIKHLHLYASYFIDEFSLPRITDPKRRNFTSFKGGFSLTDWPLRNIFLGGEYTLTNPITFLHDQPTTKFESNRYNLGHYLHDNAEEYFAQLRFYPGRTLQLGASWVYARKGNYYEYIRGRRNPPIDQHPLLEDITWTKNQLVFDAVIFPLPNLRVFARYIISDIQGYDVDDLSAKDYLDMFTPSYLHGRTNTPELGFGMGF